MKTNLDKLFKLDAELEDGGVDFSIDDNTSFRVRHFSPTNQRVKAALAAYYKPFATQIEMGALDAKKDLEIRIKMFIDVSLVSWIGVEIDGESVECNKENALKLFLRLPNLFEALWRHANDSQNYREDLGNS